jgi:hypothetical protein
MSNTEQSNTSSNTEIKTVNGAKQPEHNKQDEKKKEVKTVGEAKEQRKKDADAKPADGSNNPYKGEVREGPEATQYFTPGGKGSGISQATGPVLRSEVANTETGAVNVSAENNPAVKYKLTDKGFEPDYEELAQRKALQEQEEDMAYQRRKSLRAAVAEEGVGEEDDIGSAKYTVRPE